MPDTITQSEIMTWLSCRRKYHLAYTERLRPRARPLVLAYGTAWHEALRRLYSAPTCDADGVLLEDEDAIRADVLAAANMIDPDEVIAAAQAAGEGQIDYPADWAERKAHLPAMLRGQLRAYLDTYSRHEFAEVRGIEHRLETTFCGFRLSGKPDGLVRDRHGFWWLLEHKTTSSIRADTVLNLWTDFQISFYLLLCQLMREQGGTERSEWRTAPNVLSSGGGTVTAEIKHAPGSFPEVEGVVYNVARKPALRPSGRRVLVVDGAEFVGRTQGEAVERAELARCRIPPAKQRVWADRQETHQEYEDRVTNTILAEPAKYFLRENVQRSPEQDAEFGTNLTQIIFEMCDGPHYANPQHCPRCQFRALCTAPKSARDEVRETLYVEKEQSR